MRLRMDIEVRIIRQERAYEIAERGVFSAVDEDEDAAPPQPQYASYPVEPTPAGLTR